MSALDWDGTQPRLAGAERDLTDLVKALPTSRFTVVTFGKSVRQELPSTSDLTLIGADRVAAAHGGPVRGHRLPGGPSARPAPATLLEHLRTQHPDRRRLLVLMTDGENTSPGAQRSFASLRPLLDAGLVLGYGTEQGARMPLDATRPGDGWVIDAATGAPAVSHADPANLHTDRRAAGCAVPDTHQSGRPGRSGHGLACTVHRAHGRNGHREGWSSPGCWLWRCSSSRWSTSGGTGGTSGRRDGSWHEKPHSTSQRPLRHRRCCPHSCCSRSPRASWWRCTRTARDAPRTPTASSRRPTRVRPQPDPQPDGAVDRAVQRGRRTLPASRLHRRHHRLQDGAAPRSHGVAMPDPREPRAGLRSRG